jgi:hypothetical protein
MAVISKNMAILRRFALGLVRANKSKRSVKTRESKQVGTPLTCSNCCTANER